MIVVVDSVTALDAACAGAVVVTGSHGGLIAAHYAAAAGVKAVIFNDAGSGLDAAGIAGLAALEQIGIAAAAVLHTSARIGEGKDTLAEGVVGHLNAPARRCGVAPGQRCRVAAECLLGAPTVGRRELREPGKPEGRATLVAASSTAPAVIAMDSIGLVQARDANAVLVIGSHGGLHGGDPSSALAVAAPAAFFNDAGRGKDDAGTSRLPILGARGIAAGTVDHQSARIGDAQSMWATGVLSCVNIPLAGFGVGEGVALREAIERIRRRTVPA